MPMKVIVCFGSVRVTVPCGEGDIPVSELIAKAVHRYRRATGKTSDQWVEVTTLKSISGGGLLDPDDLLADVVDDREQLIAEYDEQDRPTINHNGGDGASASSTGTVSPEFFQDGGPSREEIHTAAAAALGGVALGNVPQPSHNSTCSNNAATDVIITPRDLSIGSNLRVRRGSDPCVNSLADELATDSRPPAPLSVHRPRIPRRESVRDSDEPRSESSDEDKMVPVSMTGSLDRKRLGPSRFVRDAFRTSLSNKTEMFRWLEAQERTEERDKEAKERTGPVDGHDGKDIDSSTLDESSSISDRLNIILHNDGGPLGIHAVPASSDDQGVDMGLLIQSVEPGLMVFRDGRIQPEDIIVEINGQSLMGVPFTSAQEIFRSAKDTHEISLVVLKARPLSPPVAPSPKQRRAPAPPVLPKPRSHAPVKPSPLTLPSESDSHMDETDTSLPPTPVNSFESTFSTQHREVDSGIKSESLHSSERPCSVSSSSSNNYFTNQKQSYGTTKTLPVKKQANNVIKPGPPIRPPKKPAPAVPVRSPNTTLSPDVPVNAVYNTRKIGRKIQIPLRKGALGLGFSVTSRDNQTDGQTPIYIKSILPKGAAVQDGQLKPGDRLMEVNGLEMTGKTQKEAVEILRELPQGSLATLLVSRQEEVEEKFRVPRKMSDSSSAVNGVATVSSIEGHNTPSSMSASGGMSDDGHLEASPDDSSSVPTISQSFKIAQPAEEHSGDVTERITFYVAPNETGRAGLGVSVKGKTEPTEEGLRDLGIFVNSVLQGGAAFKDGRLEVNDQLLDVNGVSLEDLPNTAAMDALRDAMMDDSQMPGDAMQVTVARRTGGSHTTSPNDSMVDTKPPIYHARSVSSCSADQPVAVHHQRSSSASEVVSPSKIVERFGNEVEMPSPIPPVRQKRVAALRERFTSDSGSNGFRNVSYMKANNESLEDNGLRNDSYMKANNDSLDYGATGLRNDSYMRANEESFHGSGQPASGQQEQQPQYSMSKAGRDDVSDIYAVPHKPERPHSTIGFLHDASMSDDEAFKRESLASNGSDLSPSGEVVAPFAREGFGRQSMSEKRKGHIDPKSSEIYKLAKANKENKGAVSGSLSTPPALPSSPPPHVSVKGLYSARSQAPPPVPPPKAIQPKHDPVDRTRKPLKASHEPTPSALRRSSSVEDLSPVPGQAPRHAPSGMDSAPTAPGPGLQQSRDASPGWRSNPTRFGRARACNESFRAAVDRSFDPLDPALMDTLEEESVESGQFTLDPSHSTRSSISSEATSDDTGSLGRRKGKDRGDKQRPGGLLKGFLRFGKGRKSTEEAVRRSKSEERPGARQGSDTRVEPPSHIELPSEHIQAYGDAQNAGFMPVATTQGQGYSKGRRVSNQENERPDEQESARLKEMHQRLRSQSVDPTMGRQKLSSSSSNERSSPFQPYQPSSQQQHHHVQHHHSQHHPHHDLDPRTFHPAAMSQSLPQAAYDGRRGTHQYAPPPPEPSRPNIAKNVMSRAEYIQSLRTLYQQRHRQNHGVYPLDDTEEFYERQIQDLETQYRSPPESAYNDRTRKDPNLAHFTERRPSEKVQETHQGYFGNNSASMPNVAAAAHLSQKQPGYSSRHGLYTTNTHQPGLSATNSSHNNSSARPYQYTQQRSREEAAPLPPTHPRHNNPPQPHNPHYQPRERSYSREAYTTSSSSSNYAESTAFSNPEPLYQTHPQPFHPPASQSYNAHYRSSSRPRVDSTSAKV